MKNNDLNRNILRAISIGLAAAMTLMPSVSAFADDGEGGGDSGSSSGSSESHESHDSSESKSDHTEKAEKAEESTREASEEVKDEEHHEEEHHEEEHHEEENHEEEHHEEEHHEEPAPASESEPAPASESEPAPAVEAESAPAVEAESAPAADTSVITPNSPDTPIGDALSDAADALVSVAEQGAVSDAAPGYESAPAAEAESAPVADTSAITPNSPTPIGDALSDAADALVPVAEQGAFSDAAAHNAATMIEQYNSSVEAADDTLSAVEIGLNFAGGVVDNADTAVSQAFDTVNADNEAVKAASGVVYTSESAAAEARNDAEEKISNAENSLNDLTKDGGVIDTAENSLEASKEKLDEVSTSLEKAKEDYEKADKAVKTAKDEFKKLLIDNGIDYKEDGDNIIANTGSIDDIKDGNMRKALDKAAEALDLATKDYEAAFSDYQLANSNASDTLQEIKNTYEESSLAYNSAMNALSELPEINKDAVEEYESLSALRDKAFLDKTWPSYSDYILGIVKNIIIEENGGNVDTDSFTYKTTKNGQMEKEKTVKVYDGKKGDGRGAGLFKVTYRLTTGEEKVFEYRYDQFDAAGEFTDTLNKVDHFEIIRYENGVSTGESLIGENATDLVFLNNLKTDYDNKMTKDRLQSIIDDSKEVKALLELATTVVDGAVSDVDKRSLEDVSANVDKAAEANEKVKEELASLNFNAGLPSNEGLADEIQKLRAQISELKQNNRLTTENGGWALTELLLKYKLQKEEGVDPNTVVLPKNNGRVERIDGNYADHRATLTYIKDGEKKTLLVDWVAYIENEDGSVTADTTGYSKDISYYDVVLKEVDENGNPIAGVKGSSYISEKEFLKDLERYEQLTKMESYTETIKNMAETIKEYRERVDAKEKLKDKVAAAETGVKDAAEALRRAELKQSFNRQLIKNLEDDLIKAREEYESAKDKLDEAEKKAESLEGLIDEMKEAVKDIRFEEEKGDTGENADDSGESSDNRSSDSEERSRVRRRGGSGSSDSGSSDSGSSDSGSSDSGTSDSAPSTGSDSSGGTVEAGDGAISAATFTGDVGYGEMLAAVGGGQEAVITADAGAGEEPDAAVLGDLAAPAVEEAVAAPQLESDVLGERMAPIVKSVEDGTFGRKMLLTEESLKIPFPWWILFFVLGAAGVKIYTDKKKRMSAENRTEGQ